MRIYEFYTKSSLTSSQKVAIVELLRNNAQISTTELIKRSGASYGAVRKALDLLGIDRRAVSAAVGSSYRPVKGYTVGADGKRHGRATDYNRGCRCDLCSAAHAERMEECRKSRMERAETDAPHGTMSGYWNWGCLCDACRAVGSRVNRERTATPEETQWNKGERWVDADVDILRGYDVTAREHAMAIGRTVHGVNTRRSVAGIRR